MNTRISTNKSALPTYLRVVHSDVKACRGRPWDIIIHHTMGMHASIISCGPSEQAPMDSRPPSSPLHVINDDVGHIRMAVMRMMMLTSERSWTHHLPSPTYSESMHTWVSCQPCHWIMIPCTDRTPSWIHHIHASPVADRHAYVLEGHLSSGLTAPTHLLFRRPEAQTWRLCDMMVMIQVK